MKSDNDNNALTFDSILETELTWTVVLNVFIKIIYIIIFIIIIYMMIIFKHVLS